jgi:hypothetical protein
METGNAKHAIHLIDLTADHYFGERQARLGVLIAWKLIWISALHQLGLHFSFARDEGVIVKMTTASVWVCDDQGFRPDDNPQRYAGAAALFVRSLVLYHD